MSGRKWNKLLGRLMNATARQSQDGARATARRWLVCMERRTGKTCFLIPWGA